MWNADMWHDWGWGMWFMPFIWVVIVAAVVVGAIFLVRALNRDRPAAITQPARTQHGTTAPDDPGEIVKRRYAAGEIDREEYLRKLDDLGP